MATLKLPYIEAKPKKFTILDSHLDTIGLSGRADLQKALDDIRLHVTRGTELPARYYRKDHLSTPDEMLETYDLMHLHPGNPNTREVFVVVQTTDEVILIAVTDHGPFETKPPGVLLHNRFASRIAQRDQESQQAQKAERERKNTDLRARLNLPPKPSTTESAVDTSSYRSLIDLLSDPRRLH